MIENKRKEAVSSQSFNAGHQQTTNLKSGQYS